VGEETMNAEQLKKNVGEDFFLRPYPRLVRPRSSLVKLFAPFLRGTKVLTSAEPFAPKETMETDYKWRLEDVNASDGTVTLHCLYTGHEVTLGADNVREYRTTGHLLLKCQLTLDGNQVRIEPI